MLLGFFSKYRVGKDLAAGLTASLVTIPDGLASAVLAAERTLIGVAIGISCLTLGHWSVHGLIMGMLFSIPLAFSGLMAPENPEFGRAGLFAWTIVLGMIYGLLIELVTSVLFKAKNPGWKQLAAG